MAYPGFAAVVIGMALAGFLYYMFSSDEEQPPHQQPSNRNTTRSRSRSTEIIQVPRSIQDYDTRSRRRVSTINSDDCTICLCTTTDTKNIVLPRCNHVFHVACLQKWKNIESSCPNCRVPF